MATSTIPQVMENVSVITPTYNKISNSVTINSLSFIKKGHELVIDINIHVTSDITHGTNLFNVIGVGNPVADNVPSSILRSASGMTAGVRAIAYGTGSLIVVVNGTIKTGDYYIGHMTVFTK